MTLTRGFWYADLESGDGFGGRAAGLGQQLVAVVDAEGMVGGLDGQGSSSIPVESSVRRWTAGQPQR